jgi:large subunit ribosomal protein L9
MANNQVLLLQPINGLGAEGDTVTVKAGFARNFLLPRKLALPITQANKKHVESLLKAREEATSDCSTHQGARVTYGGHQTAR